MPLEAFCSAENAPPAGFWTLYLEHTRQDVYSRSRGVVWIYGLAFWLFGFELLEPGLVNSLRIRGYI